MEWRSFSVSSLAKTRYTSSTSSRVVQLAMRSSAALHLMEIWPILFSLQYGAAFACINNGSIIVAGIV